MRVESYWNLHKHVFSIRALEGDSKGKVIEHVSHTTLHDVTFAVQPAGRAKVLREQKKNVHAFVRGDHRNMRTEEVDARLDEYQGIPPFWMEENWVKVTYNPYKYDSFVDTDGNPVHRAEWAVLLTDNETGRAKILAYKPS